MNVIIYSQNKWERCGHLMTTSPVTILEPKRLLLGTTLIELDEEVGCVYSENAKEITHITLNFIAKSNHKILSELKKDGSGYKIVSK